MSKTKEGLYQASEFAALTGVTVRALHHYDRLGLLRPSGRTAGGYRLYGEQDFARLQQIVTLKFIGFSLKQIKAFLGREPLDLRTALRAQRELLEEKRRQVERAIRAIGLAEYAVTVAPDGEPAREALKKIIEVINMSDQMDWKKYYSEEARQKIEARAATIPRESIEQGQRDWAALIKEVEEAVREGIDPQSERAQALAARWSALVRSFTGGDPAIQEGLNKMYADMANWPASFPKPYSDEACAFIRQTMAAGKKG